MSISNYLENKLLGAVYNSAAFGVGNNPYISLHDSDPGETGAGEITAGAFTYARQQSAFGSPGAGATENAGAITWTNLPAKTITHLGVWDAVSSGNFLWGGALNTSKTTNAGDTFTINSGSLDVTLD